VKVQVCILANAIAPCACCRRLFLFQSRVSIYSIFVIVVFFRLLILMLYFAATLTVVLSIILGLLAVYKL
jgi:hypothetical protein